MKFIHDDGGRAAAGYKGSAGDCVTRAIAIATGLPYQEVYDELAKRQRIASAGRVAQLTKFKQSSCDSVRKLRLVERTIQRTKRDSSPRNGVTREVYDAYLKKLGWKFMATMSIGSGCKVHVSPSELPGGRIILRLSRHLAAFIDGEAA